jgi:hypothetical protein
MLLGVPITYYVSLNGNDKDGCGLYSYSPCKTIDRSITESSSSSIISILDDGSFQSSKLTKSLDGSTNSKNEYGFIGIFEKPTINTVYSSNQWVNCTYLLFTLTNLKIVHNGQITVSSYSNSFPLIYLFIGATVTCTSVTFASSESSTIKNSFFLLNDKAGNELKMNHCEFKNINIDFVLIYLSYKENSQTLWINDTLFEDITCNRKGGNKDNEKPEDGGWF